jgi:hypothetical protein
MFGEEVSRFAPWAWRIGLARTPASTRRSAAERDEAERLRAQLVRANHARDVEDMRREALVDSVVVAVPAALSHARTQAWDAGWDAACNGMPKSANPMRQET